MRSSNTKDKNAVGSKRRGRPSTYNDTLGAQICEHIAAGLSIREISLIKGMPPQGTIWQWAAQKPEFTEIYARAMERRMDHLAEEIIQISDDGSNDWMARQGKDGGGYELNGEHVQRSKLRVDTRKWIMARLAPRKYGDRVNHDHSGSVTLEHLVTGSMEKKGE